MKKVKLNNIAILVLFITSYIPLFSLLIIRQIKQNIDYFEFGGLKKGNFLLAFEMFGLSYFFLFISILGYIGLRFLLANLNINKSNGELVKVIDVENKNSESIGYISTYIVPFIFQDTNNLFDISSILLVLLMIFFIYTKSNMIVINPILSITHTLYQIEYNKKNKTKKALLITKEGNLENDEEIKINLITKNIYYG
ncbi:hypothetical protein QE422_003428 [Chryseobacterium sp. SORGH_AS 447]|uniref:hypothetical protein n=1 Tax=Chryseobacterium sp. SORGH_AS_0447 TaxID=3041769 RepID=UPI00278B633D|nr:hypothetical protein [Chryseobacterium sp. SORGH_AS_0447]MDQ1163060.1 hypothetical protein [Chryseobacterium sp. SORGH_AS_0447]